MSLFTNLLNLYSSGNKPVEDFFTEIIAYCFSLPNDIFLYWLKQSSLPGRFFALLNPSNSTLPISPPLEYKKLELPSQHSRLDIVVDLVNELTTDLIFIECKIGFGEINGQLKRYAEILNEQQASNKYLLYIGLVFDF
ncbi:PD-(D/E)XK nuclease family protein [Sphaerospermopsis aphanizomenoides BCCUSP55]|uniref:PD-(D/E)XK nuclease family protein n=1 Tax=Sphaerospermopsis aphanizomenoides TaxID=459663 RepID=UPI00190558BB|nr:PD-(D/E)XK nuclease family protein [Sphaerospermopsis aphanizomenoides]MBK1989468.1 PD-(D/E)XK nuclease family protein [Sphaerospermopsis aphanizomenoides BCCUSP55]